MFERIQKASPSPYEFFLQFGDEQLIGASPEMFVRVEQREDGRRVETCPIAGTARRTGDPLRDADNIRELLSSAKEESELTMCTDVDRNDKSRVCKPGTVQVIARRLIECYAGVFHTVDHVEGMLADGFDSLDAFLTHMWAVTVIGAPKKWAAQAIENLEKDARGWYGGAVGMISLDGDINTGITIRTVHLRDGVAAYPRGRDAALRFDSGAGRSRMPPESHRLLPGAGRAVRREHRLRAREATKPGGVRLLLVDNEDCFIHTLANYARQTGAEVITYRAGFPLEMIEKLAPSLILVSPGPGRPEDFGVPGAGSPRRQARNPGVRRVPGFAGDGGGLRRRAGGAGLPHARQAVHGHAIAAWAFSRVCRKHFEWDGTIPCSPSVTGCRAAWK